MKHCPSCQTNYADDTLRFCLQDGTQLVDYAPAPAPSAAWNEPETVVKEKPAAWEQPSQVTRIGVPPPEARKSSTARAVLLTALAMFLLFGGGIAAWLFLRNNSEVAVNSNAANFNGLNVRQNANAGNSGNVKLGNSADNANRSNANASVSPTPANTATSTPTPSVNAEQVKSEVSGRIYGWKSALESGNFNSLMGNYADRLDYYYGSSNVGIERVRSDKQRAFNLFYDFRVKISNLRITPEPSGERATAVFDKEWEFEGSDHRNAGKVQSQFQLTKIGNRWQITGERDLKVYYIEK